MNSRTRSSLYYADDKDIYDILHMLSTKKRKDWLIEKARERNILLSMEDNYDDLVRVLTQYYWNWTQVDELMNIKGLPERKYRTSVERTPVVTDSSKINEIVENIRKRRQELLDEVIIGGARDDKHFEIVVKYAELDTQKTRLHQKIEREFKIQVEVFEERTSIRFPQLPRAKEIADEIVADLEATQKDVENLEREVISLDGIHDSTLRTQFFLSLISGLEGCKVEDVTTLKLASIIESDDDNSDFHTNEENEEVLNMNSADEKFLGIVKAASYIGSQLLASKEFASFRERGFYISNIVWSAVEQKGENRLIEIEAGFKGNANFSYKIKGYKSPKTGGGFTTSVKNFKESEILFISKKIEDAAFKSKRIIDDNYATLQEKPDKIGERDEK